MVSFFLVSNGGEANPLHCVKTLVGQSDSVRIGYILFPTFPVVKIKRYFAGAFFAA
jgi:hypothetical protein